MTKKKKGDSSMSKTKGSSMQRKNIGGLGDYIVLKEEKEVLFYLEQPYPTCLAMMKHTQLNLENMYEFFL